MEVLLDVRGLRTQFHTKAGVVRAVDGVSWNVCKGETVALVGESGCGKSVSALSVMRLVSAPAGRIVDKADEAAVDAKTQLSAGVNHARALHEAGLARRDIQRRLWEMARLPVRYFAEGFAATERAAGRGDADTVWRARSPDEIYLAVAGGPGPQDVYIGAGMPQTRAIRGA